MSEPVAPPVYSHSFPGETETDPSFSSAAPQILILPAPGAGEFQKGYVGVKDERATIEGEVQLKTGTSNFGKVYVYISDVARVKVSLPDVTRSIRLATTERTRDQVIELITSETELWNISNASGPIPSSLSFSIPLTDDIPQCIHTPYSALTHELTVFLHPTNIIKPTVTQTAVVHIRRYASHTLAVVGSPQTQSLHHPTQVQVEISRTVFQSGETIPLYIQIPSPDRTLVVDRGLRLRNIRAELVRTIRIKQSEPPRSPSPEFLASPSTSSAPKTLSTEKLADLSTDQNCDLLYESIIAHSGAVCRFHLSRDVRIRCLLRPPSHQSNTSDRGHDTEDPSFGPIDTSSPPCSSITQETLAHDVQFSARVNVTFMDMHAHTETVQVVTFPIRIVPPSAPLPQVEENLTHSYAKKHDRPPVRTNRYDEGESSAPRYHDNEAGPSAYSSAAPPPFEEPDAPPPFFHDAPGPSSSRPPTFHESESHVLVPDVNQNVGTDSVIQGEGTLFGFPAAEQFDGHPEDMARSDTPPPTLEMATLDVDVTNLVDVSSVTRTGEGNSNDIDELAPPPPPALDDPLDPPPSIDSDFRAPHSREAQTSSSSSPPRSPYLSHTQRESPSDVPSLDHIDPPNGAQSNEPPPYLNLNQPDGSQTPRPPPYHYEG